MNVLSSSELNQWLASHQGWSVANDEIVQTFMFNDFTSAFGFMARLALYAEKHNHHPTIVNSYNTVKISMNTHDADNRITDKDIKLAEAIESLT